MAGAQQLTVRYGDGNTKTFALCEDCRNDFRTADLVEEMTLLDRPDDEVAE